MYHRMRRTNGIRHGSDLEKMLQKSQMSYDIETDMQGDTIYPEAYVRKSKTMSID